MEIQEVPMEETFKELNVETIKNENGIVQNYIFSDPDNSQAWIKCGRHDQTLTRFEV